MITVVKVFPFHYLLFDTNDENEGDDILQIYCT